MFVRLAMVVFSLFLLITSALADTLVVRNPDGSSSTLPDLTLLGISTRPDGGRDMVVLFPDGAQNPVDLARAISIEFTPPGRPGTMMVGADQASAKEYRATLRSFANGSFLASPEGSADQFAVPAANIFSFVADGAPPPGTTSPLPTTGSPFDASAAAPPADFFASPESTGDTGMSATGGEDDFSGDDEDYQMTPEEAAAQAEFEASLQREVGLAVGYLIFAVIVLLLFTVTYFWLMINAFMQGEIGWGIGIMLCGCCILVKPMYLKHYKGRGKNAASVLVIIETILVIISNIAAKFIE